MASAFLTLPCDSQYAIRVVGARLPDLAVPASINEERVSHISRGSAVSRTRPQCSPPDMHAIERTECLSTQTLIAPRGPRDDLWRMPLVHKRNLRPTPNCWVRPRHARCGTCSRPMRLQLIGGSW